MPSNSFARRAAVLLFCLTTPLLPSDARAAGPVHGARAAGMGTAFTAVADDPSAMAYNPAGLARVPGTQVYAGVAPVIPATTFRDPSGLEETTQREVFPVPHLYASSDLGSSALCLGVAVFSPFGIGGRTWSASGLTRYASVESTIATLWINPTVAYRVSGSVSVAGGIDYMRAWSTARRRVDQSALGAPDAELGLDVSGDGWGYNAGLLVAPTDDVRVGAAFRSGIAVEQSGAAELSSIAPPLQGLFGGAAFQTRAHTPVDFPAIVSVGVAWRPAQVLTLAIDVEQVRWSSFRTGTVHVDQPVPEAGFTDVIAPLDWTDAWSAKIGAEWQVTGAIALRGGYFYAQTPVPDSTLEPSNPDSDAHTLTLGAGVDSGIWTADVFYGAALYATRTSSFGLAGSYSNFAHYAGVSVGRTWSREGEPARARARWARGR